MNEKGKPSRGVCVCEVGRGGGVKQLLHFENIVDETEIKVRSHGATSRKDMLRGHVAGTNFIVCHVPETCRDDKKLSLRHVA